jgi:hypothetical protein
MPEKRNPLVVSTVEQLMQPRTRREFFRLAAIGGSVVLLPSLFGACDDDDDPTGTGGTAVTLDLRNDTGILNFAYALEQLEAAFYTRVVASFAGSGLSAAEQVIFTDIRNHEVIHREALKALITSGRIRDNLQTDGDFNGTNFSSRTSILATARAFEDLGVSAYNNLGQFITNPGTLLVAGKIVSVEARHAAVIRDLINPDGLFFAGDDIVDTNGLDNNGQPSTPTAILTAADPYITTAITISNQPA